MKRLAFSLITILIFWNICSCQEITPTLGLSTYIGASSSSCQIYGATLVLTIGTSKDFLYLQYELGTPAGGYTSLTTNCHLCDLSVTRVYASVGVAMFDWQALERIGYTLSSPLSEHASLDIGFVYYRSFDAAYTAVVPINIGLRFEF